MTQAHWTQAHRTQAHRTQALGRGNEAKKIRQNYAFIIYGIRGKGGLESMNAPETHTYKSSCKL